MVYLFLSLFDWGFCRCPERWRLFPLEFMPRTFILVLCQKDVHLSSMLMYLFSLAYQRLQCLKIENSWYMSTLLQLAVEHVVSRLLPQLVSSA